MSSARSWPACWSAVELPIHALSALAIYVGRIHRFNSWDLVQVAGIVVMFTCLTVGQAAMRILLLDRLRGATG